MKQAIIKLALSALFLVPFAAKAVSIWHLADAGQISKNVQPHPPASFLVYTMDEAATKLQLYNLSADPAEGIIITLPLPDGSFRDFRVWQTPMMPAGLAAKYPDIKTFTAVATDNRSVTAKLDYTLFGFHAMIFDGSNTSFIDPYDNFNDGYYMVHYKRDERRSFTDRMKCLVHSHDEDGPGGTANADLGNTHLPRMAQKTINGYDLRTYRLALAADHYYCAAPPAAATIPLALSKMTTSMNRINGVYEREFSITMIFAAGEDQIIWPTATGSSNGADPFNAIDADAGSCLVTNQSQCDSRVGTANYDIGHVFTTGAGGLSLVGCVCAGDTKAQSVTGSSSPSGDGFDIDYVVHEMGHEFGSDHTFNNNQDGSCSGNAESYCAYEPGSGSTIMCYAGICNPDDLQPHSDAYFCASSLQQIQGYITTDGDACAVKTPTNNKLVSYAPFNTTYSIPYQTPFELIAPIATDSVGDSTILYCWEQNDLGDFGARLTDTHVNGPIFRSFNPTTSPLRVFPTESMVIAGTLSNAGTENAEGEKAPDVTRDLHFQCTFRDIINNLGCFTIPDDQVTIHAINTGVGFTVTSQNTTGIAYTGGSTQTITWNVIGTNAAPYNAANVDIYMSVSGGNTWPFYVGTFPNTGSASVTLPNPPGTTLTARFKVKGSGNVFFNINGKNFSVTENPTLPLTPSGVQQARQPVSGVTVFPVPATNIVHITCGAVLQATVYNAVGQQVWQGQVSQQANIDISTWARGMYYIQLTDADNNRVVKRFVAE